MNPTFTKNYTAGAAINPYRIVQHGAADGAVIQGAGVTSTLIGVTGEIGADAAGDRVDVHLSGQPDVEYGGTVTRGDPLTSDSVGRAVTAAPAAGVNNRIIGFATVSAVLGDIAPMDLAPGRIQG